MPGDTKLDELSAEFKAFQELDAKEHAKIVDRVDACSKEIKLVSAEVSSMSGKLGEIHGWMERDRLEAEVDAKVKAARGEADAKVKAAEGVAAAEDKAKAAEHRRGIAKMLLQIFVSAVTGGFAVWGAALAHGC